MSRATRAAGLTRALAALMPTATFSVLHERPWHSLTFAGHQICVSMCMEHGNSFAAEQFARGLTDHAFNLPRQLVADIAVTEIRIDDDKVTLTVDTLLLDD